MSSALPVLIEEAQGGIRAALLFHPGVHATGGDAAIALARLERLVLDRLAKLVGPDAVHQLQELLLAPTLVPHWLSPQVTVAGRTQRWSVFAVWCALGSRELVFVPARQLWIQPDGDGVAANVARALDQTLRARPEDRTPAPPEPLRQTRRSTRLGWIDVTVPPQRVAMPDPAQWLAERLGGGIGNGREELYRTGICLDALHPEGLTRAWFREDLVTELSALLARSDRQPVLLVGRHGAGKTTLVHEATWRRAQARTQRAAEDARIWHLSPQRLISGMWIVGMWETRLRRILAHAHEHDLVLYFDDLLGLFSAGTSAVASLSLAHLVRVALEERSVRVLAEITPEALRVLREKDRAFADRFAILPVPPTDPETTARIALRTAPDAPLDCVRLAVELHAQYSRRIAAPGAVAAFLARLGPVGHQDQVVQAFHRHHRGGPPGKAQAAAFARFGEGIVGQDAALAAIRRQLRLSLANLQDGERPRAVFLFVGPTGVGKTETARTLAQTLCGSIQGLIRLDMNQYVDAHAAALLVGTFDQPDGHLTTPVRQAPFSVVLLDEIEKAHPAVLDLLLQVFGDGRLTDARGEVTDFTNTVIVMTSNLGVREAQGQVGFGEGGSDAAYEAAARRFFRPELFNRIDRVVPFQPLPADGLEQVVESLLARITSREGLARRRCALDVRPSARRTLVELGRDPHLGARALRRAIEQQLVRPLAQELEHTPPAPALLVRVAAADGQLVRCTQALAFAPRVARPPLAGTLRRRLTLLGQLVDRVLERNAADRPRGAFDPSDRSPATHRYLTLVEQAERVRALVREAEDQLVLPTGQRGLRLRLRHPGRKEVERSEAAGTASQLLWKDQCAIASIEEFLAGASAPGPTTVAEVSCEQAEGEAALLGLLAEAPTPRWHERCVLLHSGDPDLVFGDFADPWEVEVERLTLPAAARADRLAAFRLHGPLACLLGALHTGFALVAHPDRTSLLEGSLLDLGPDQEPVARVTGWLAQRDAALAALRPGAAPPPELAAPPITAVTWDRKGWIDVRTGRPWNQPDLRSAQNQRLPAPAVWRESCEVEP